MTFWNRFAPHALSLLRIVAGFLFVQHGLAKLFGWFGGQAVPTYSLFWYAGVIETAGGPLIIAGLLTRPLALVLAGEMLAAYLIAHRPLGGWPFRNGGAVPLLFSLIFLHLASAGGGKLALDSLRSAKASRSGRRLEKFTQITLMVLRVGAAFLFFQYGSSKLLGWFGGRRVAFPQLRWFAGLLETVGAPFIALGLFLRAVTFVLAGEMAVAYWTSHFPRGQGFWPIQNGGEPAVLFCFIYLYLLTAGPGVLSLDGLPSKANK